MSLASKCFDCRCRASNTNVLSTISGHCRPHLHVPSFSRYCRTSSSDRRQTFDGLSQTTYINTSATNLTIKNLVKSQTVTADIPSRKSENNNNKMIMRTDIVFVDSQWKIKVFIIIITHLPLIIYKDILHKDH